MLRCKALHASFPAYTKEMLAVYKLARSIRSNDCHLAFQKQRPPTMVIDNLEFVSKLIEQTVSKVRGAKTVNSQKRLLLKIKMLLPSWDRQIELSVTCCSDRFYVQSYLYSCIDISCLPYLFCVFLYSSLYDQFSKPVWCTNMKNDKCCLIPHHY